MSDSPKTANTFLDLAGTCRRVCGVRRVAGVEIRAAVVRSVVVIVVHAVRNHIGDVENLSEFIY